jgi:capsular exopolysaccharide synthesis family protein
MSKNFEVLVRAERETDFFEPVSIPTEMAHPPRHVPLPTNRPSVHIDAAVHEEEMRLVQRVFLLPGSQSPGMVVFCAVDHAAGAAGICARAAENLAAQTTSQVCIIDGNLHSPSLHSYFGLKNDHGLTDVVLQPGSMRNFVNALPGNNLSLLCAGPRCDESPALWKSDRLRSLMAEIRKEFRYILIYAPPAITHVDAALLGQLADGVILIVESNITRRETARKAKEAFVAANVKVLGAVLNNRTFPIPEFLYRKL